MANKNISLSPELLKRNASEAEALLKELANANRLMILCSLAEGEKSVGVLEKVVNLSQSALSQHLARLRDAGLVDARKEGQSIFYRISSMEAQTVLSVLYVMYCNKK